MNGLRPLPHDFARRLRAKDASLWSDDPAEQARISERLGWVDAHERMRERIPAIAALVEDVRADGFEQVLVLGMGGSSLAAEVFGEAFRGTAGGLDLRICDSTVPSAVRAATDWAAAAKTLFIVASKSGTTTEVDALYRYFSGEHGAGSDYVAITDPGTSLAERASAEGFRACLLNPPDVGGRYAALTLFGLVPAALAGVDVSQALDGAADWDRRWLRHEPGVWAGCASRWLVAADPPWPERHVRWLASLNVPAELWSWAEQLVAESTGKNGRGLLPICGTPPASHAPALQPRDVGEVTGPFGCGYGMALFEGITAAIGARLGVNPFDQPDVDAAKQRTRDLLTQFESTQELRAPPAASARNVQSLLAELRDTDEYIGLLAFVDRTAEIDSKLGAIAASIEPRGVAVSIGYGPRYLHSTGQFHKGGPDCGAFVMITADDEDLPIPGKPYGFQTLCLAQAYGDFQALTDKGRRVVRWHIDGDVADGLAQLRDAVSLPLV